MNLAIPRRRRLRRGIVILPSAFTLGNLFLGIWAIIDASRGDYLTAGWLIVLAAVMDMFDGRVARFTATGSPFGEELDSLVDAVSF
ncbi:MAG TPA: CDP-alcohol phosphatidyltransferase family protein, partial [Longimicrobium sp.]|nr:CDP-alcohol phosphatidyltransferase family protein [Longimicrobium sp.]